MEIQSLLTDICSDIASLSEAIDSMGKSFGVDQYENTSYSDIAPFSEANDSVSKSFDVDQDEITPLSQFVASRNLKPTQRQRYIEVGASDDIMHFINRGGGQSMGTECERFARHIFPSLGKRLKGDTKKSGYDQIHLPTGYKVEQKSAGNWNKEDKSWKWQHIEPKHPWKFLLLCGIGYEDIYWFYLSRANFTRFCEEGLIDTQGDEDGNSYQGWWFSYQVMKEHLTELKTNDDLDKLAIDQCPRDAH